MKPLSKTPKLFTLYLPLLFLVGLFAISIHTYPSAVYFESVERPTIEIQLHPGIVVNGEMGASYAIERAINLEEDIWAVRTIINMTTSRVVWIDPRPISSSLNLKRFYRARVIKVDKQGEE